MATNSDLINILLVDDNPHDILLTKEAFKETNRPLKINEVHDGVEALKYLNREAPYKDAETPHLILLDINMPKLSGIEVLQRIKSNPKLQSIPVIILSTSSDSTEIAACYRLYANSYIAKPISYFKLVELVKKLLIYWFDTNLLPPKR